MSKPKSLKNWPLFGTPGRTGVDVLPPPQYQKNWGSRNFSGRNGGLLSHGFIILGN